MASTLRTSETYFQYLPVSRANMEWDLYITGVGVESFAPGDRYPHEGHPGTYDFRWDKGRVLPEYQIVHITRGRGLFESAEMGQVEVKAGDAILLFPGHWHRYRPDTATGWQEHWISWNGQYLYRLARRRLISPAEAVLVLASSQEVLALHQRILEAVRQHPGENSRVLAAVGMEMLATILESAGEKPMERARRRLDRRHAVQDPIVAEALRIIWTHSYRNSGVDALVDRIAVTRRTLERRFKATLGHSVGQEIARCRVERAKHLLGNTNLPIEHVALAVGFSGIGRLGRVFQRLEKTTPRAYRKKVTKG